MFPEALELAHNAIQEVAVAGKEVDYLVFFIETLMNDFMDHLRRVGLHQWVWSQVFKCECVVTGLQV